MLSYLESSKQEHIDLFILQLGTLKQHETVLFLKGCCDEERKAATEGENTSEIHIFDEVSHRTPSLHEDKDKEPHSRWIRNLNNHG